jgi:glycosyltransferase involved in cell wall biosynthesis
MLRQPKRPDLLIEIAQQAPRLRFVVCGGPSVHRSPPGYGEQVLRALRALPNVDYRGQVAPDIARQVIANAAAYLLTSDKEGFPNTLLEAYSSGTPVVTLKIDPDRIIERFGLGVISRSTRQAVADLNNLMESCQKRNEICLRARNYVADAHSEKSVANAFEKAIGIAGYTRTEPIRSSSENLLA